MLFFSAIAGMSHTSSKTKPRLPPGMCQVHPIG